LTVASSDGLEEAADGDPYGVQWQAWRRPVPHDAGVVVTVPGVVLRPRGAAQDQQWRGWRPAGLAS
jgi:hypothetical protein